jgi:hypothetical protein
MKTRTILSSLLLGAIVSTIAILYGRSGNEVAKQYVAQHSGILSQEFEYKLPGMHNPTPANRSGIIIDYGKFIDLSKELKNVSWCVGGDKVFVGGWHPTEHRCYLSIILAGKHLPPGCKAVDLKVVQGTYMKDPDHLEFRAKVVSNDFAAIGLGLMIFVLLAWAPTPTQKRR